MAKLTHFRPVLISIATIVLLSYPLQALDMHTYRRMSDADQSRCVGDLVEDAENSLRQSGRPDLAVQVSHAFTTNAPDLDSSIGILALTKYLDTSVPNVKVSTAEEAMMMAMKSIGIALPPSFATALQDFRPNDPLKDKEETPISYKDFMDMLKQEATERRNAAPARPPAAPPASPALSSSAPIAPPPVQKPEPASPADDPIGGGGFISPPSDFKVLICVPSNLVAEWNNPSAGSKMDAFKTMTARYVMSVAKPDWQYWVLGSRYEGFNSSMANNGGSFISSVSPDGGHFDPFDPKCPSGYAGYYLQAHH
jgi:hypothetical protein